MTLLTRYKSKAELLAEVGRPLRLAEGNLEKVRPNGRHVVMGYLDQERRKVWYARVQLRRGKVARVW